MLLLLDRSPKPNRVDVIVVIHDATHLWPCNGVSLPSGLTEPIERIERTLRALNEHEHHVLPPLLYGHAEHDTAGSRA